MFNKIIEPPNIPISFLGLRRVLELHVNLQCLLILEGFLTHSTHDHAHVINRHVHFQVSLGSERLATIYTSEIRGE